MSMNVQLGHLFFYGTKHNEEDKGKGLFVKTIAMSFAILKKQDIKQKGPHFFSFTLIMPEILVLLYFFLFLFLFFTFI